MSSLGKPPQHLIDAAKQGKRIDLKDPYVRKMLKEMEEEKKKKKDLIIKQKEEEDELQEQREIDRAIEIEEKFTKEYEKLKFEQENTIEWNVDIKCNCAYCDSTSLRVILRPDIRHYAEMKCNLCHIHNRWLPYPNPINDCIL